MRLSFRKAMLIYTLIPIVVIFAVLSINNLVTTSNEAQQQIEKHMTDLAISYAGIFDAFLRPIESTAQINAILIEESELLTPERIYHLLELQIANNANIYGAAIAFAPGMSNAKQKLFAPYVYRKQDELKRIDIAESGYDYSDGNWEWWSTPATTGNASWTEPYFDEGGGNILMATYSVPFFKNGKIWGVATVDIHLHEISDQINIPGVESHEISVLSETGKIVLYHEKSRIGHSVYDVIKERFQAALMLAGDVDPDRIAEVKERMMDYVQQMLDGRTGMVNLEYFDLDGGYWSFFAPIKSVGWSFSIRVKGDEVFASAYRHFWHTLIFFAVSLLLIVFAVILVSSKFSRAFERVVKRCQRIERLNFQQAHTKKIKIEEIKQLWHTLNNMCQALESHFSLKEDICIAESIRKHALPIKAINYSGYEIEIQSNAGPENSQEIVDAMVFKHFIDDSQGTAHFSDAMAFLMLDDADPDLEATIKCNHLRAIFRSMIKQGTDVRSVALTMNEYLLSDLNLNGPVQAWLAVLDVNSGLISSVALGKNVLLHWSQLEQLVTQVTGNDFALSTQHTIERLSVNKLLLRTGDSLLVASDGVVMALDESRQQFGLDRLKQQFTLTHAMSASEIAGQLMSNVENHSGLSYLSTERSIIIIKKV